MVDNDVQYASVESSNLAAVGYDAENMNLFVKFKNGLTYGYLHVPERVYAELMAAESKGKYLAAHVKNVYSYTRLQT